MHRSKSPETPFLMKWRAAVPEFGHLHSRSEVESLGRYRTRHFTVSRYVEVIDEPIWHPVSTDVFNMQKDAH